jgi:hypothetical protein
MPRRSYHRASRGQVYASEWPEWHVDCAHPGCEAHALVAGLGEVTTIREAERRADELGDWRKRRGLWYCPDHA